MAHKGRRWELAFRRDFNINVETNQNGLPKQYEAQWILPLGAVPPPPRYFDIFLDYQGEFGAATLLWTGVPVAPAYGIATARYTVHLSTGPTIATKRLELFDHTSASVLLLSIDPGTPRFSTSDNIGNAILSVDAAWRAGFPYDPVGAVYPNIYGGNPT